MLTIYTPTYIIHQTRSLDRVTGAPTRTHAHARTRTHALYNGQLRQGRLVLKTSHDIWKRTTILVVIQSQMIRHGGRWIHEVCWRWIPPRWCLDAGGGVTTDDIYRLWSPYRRWRGLWLCGCKDNGDRHVNICFALVLLFNALGPDWSIEEGAGPKMTWRGN